MVNEDELTQRWKGHGYFVGEYTKPAHPKLNYIKQGELVGYFDGIDTFLDFLNKEMGKPPKDSGYNDSLTPQHEEPSFYKFDYDEALDIFRNHPERIAKFDETELRIKDVNESGNQVEYDVTGDYIDMGRYMEGVPESFGTLYNGNARNRRINVVVNLNQVSGTNEADINYRSERVLRLVDALELGGARCELKGVSSTQIEHVEVVIKHHEESLVINDLAVMTHSDFLRRALFRFKEYSKNMDWGYGRPFYFSERTNANDLSNDNVNEITVFIDGSLNGKDSIGKKFDQLERLLVWELSKSIPEVQAIKLDNRGVYFADNGTRDSEEIQREGREAINAE